MTLAVDPETGELVGSASELQALLVGDEAIEGEAFRDAVAAARHPAFTIATLGVNPAAVVLGDGSACLLVTDRPQGRRALLPMATELVPMALVAWLGLGRRPRPTEAIRLDPGAMAIVIGRAQAHGHGLEPELANALQRRLDAGVRHWTVRVAAGEWSRNLEVLEGEAGIWRVRPAGELVELTPTSTTAVLRELVDLCQRARREGRPAAP